MKREKEKKIGFRRRAGVGVRACVCVCVPFYCSCAKMFPLFFVKFLRPSPDPPGTPDPSICPQTVLDPCCLLSCRISRRNISL